VAGSPRAILTQQDLSLIPLLNLVLEQVAGSVTPSAALVGKIYRNTTSGRIEMVTSPTTIVSMPSSGTISNADIAAGAAIAMAKLALDPTLRSNHSGTQLSATISDLQSVVQAYRLDQFAAPTGTLNLGSQKIGALADGVSATDAVTLQQVQALIAAIVNGHDWKDGVRVAASTNINLAAPGASIDGIALSNGDRVLLTAQSTATQNGIYVWTGAAAALTRATDAAASAQVTSGMTIPIEAGSHAASLAILTSPDPLTLGTTALSFTYLANATAYTAGTGISVVGNVISLSAPVTVALGGTGASDAPTARANLNAAQRGVASTLGALTAGVPTTISHNLGTLDVIAQAYRVSDGASVGIGISRVDANTVSVISDVAVLTGVLRVVIEPIL
jgi:hypothetical protein